MYLLGQLNILNTFYFSHNPDFKQIGVNVYMFIEKGMFTCSLKKGIISYYFLQYHLNINRNKRNTLNILFKQVYTQ